MNWIGKLNFVMIRLEIPGCIRLGAPKPFIEWGIKSFSRKLKLPVWNNLASLVFLNVNRGAA